ncbi:MAG: peptidyl-prolyl cis-trans isomerase, partial [Gammaproteobacteria bacterium]|nr:peptidyl-prolyl cis-trans isomerase [Gammaproteobacteria bacterium]
LQMNLGEFSDAIRSPSGFHIIQLLEKRDAAQVLVTQTQARHILISPDAIQSEEEVLEKLNNLRDRIIQGGDFASIARANSIDHVSASKGGELGWVSKGQTVPQFEQTMNSLKINEVSEAFRSQYGWHIMQVTARRNIDKTDKYRFATIKQQLQKRKKQEALELWQKRLRDEAYVKFIK